MYVIISKTFLGRWHLDAFEALAAILDQHRTNKYFQGIAERTRSGRGLDDDMLFSCR